MVESRKRATASLKVKYKSATLGQFTQQFGLDISHGGIFIKTKSPLEPGVLIRLELQLSDATPVIQGSGRVRWRRMPGPDAAALPAGMGIEFIRLEPSSRALVDRILDAREGRPSRFEQTDGAEQLSASQPLASSLTSSHPPDTAVSLPPVLPSPAPSRPPGEVPDTPPPGTSSSVFPTPRAGAATGSAVNGSGLFASSGLRPGNTVVPGPDAPAQSSFFSSVHSSNNRLPAVRPVPAPPPAHSQQPPAPPAASPGRGEPEDDITSAFREPQARFDADDEVADSATTAPLTPPDRSAEHVLAPFPDLPQSPDRGPVAPPLTLGLSSLHPPPRSRSTTLIWVIVVVLALLATALAFFYVRRAPLHSRADSSMIQR